MMNFKTYVSSCVIEMVARRLKYLAVLRRILYTQLKGSELSESLELGRSTYRYFVCLYALSLNSYEINFVFRPI